MTTAKHSHYFHDVSHLQQVDIYRMLALLDIAHPALQHAFKKVAAAGKRGAKSAAQDVQEAIDSLARWQAMAAEDAIKDSERDKICKAFGVPAHRDLRRAVTLGEMDINRAREVERQLRLLEERQSPPAKPGHESTRAADHRAAWLKYFDKGPESSTAAMARFYGAGYAASDFAAGGTD